MNCQTKKKNSLAYQMIVCGMFLLAMLCTDAAAFTLNVQTPDGTPVAGYRWLVEEDTTNYTIPGALVADSIGLDIHNSYAPVVLKGKTDVSSTNIPVLANKRYIVSVLPYAGHAMGGKLVDINQSSVTVVVNPSPIPTAQITILAFNDNNPINNAPDIESGLPGFTVVIADVGGQMMQDVFGNPMGTTYQQNPDGSFVLDADGAPLVDMMGSGVITTDANGEATIKYIAPGKYGVQVIPPAGTNWIQTATIEGTKVIDAWVKANEPGVFVEGFGAGFYHVFFGFVDKTQLPWAITPPNPATSTGSISGRVVFNHFSKPPQLQGFFPGEPVGGAWVGLNDGLTGQGLYAAPCNDDGTFTITNVPPGTYQLVTWDENLDALFGFNSVVVPAGAGGTGGEVNLGDVLSFRWFGKLEGSVFYDTDQDGFRDPDEVGIPDQNVNLRFRDGTIYQAQPTDLFGEYAFEEVFPFFKWLVVEVDFARFKATGMTAVVDDGGQIPPDDGWDMPSKDMLNPQIQIDMDPLSPTFGQQIINPNTGNAYSRTEMGPVLTEAMHLFLGQNNYIDWGKAAYGTNENGGISGVVFYDTTRAENDPRYCVGETWCPGIPNVQLYLYADMNPTDGVIDDLNNDGEITIADAIQSATSDSWDDNKPTGSIQTLPIIHGQQAKSGFDNFGTWNQIRPGIFDGGYAFTSFFPGGIESGSEEVDGLPVGTYIVEVVTPPGYELVKEEDKNVDFGDTYIPSPLLLPPVCVGEPHFVPQYLSFQTDEAGVPLPGIDPADLVECEFAGDTRPLCNRKQVVVSSGKNAAADFFFFTEVPKAARAVGFVNNDLSAEFDTTSPIFGEKSAPSWIPISVQDWAGNELGRVYSDEFGAYNAMLPSTSTINAPSPSGVSPQMATLVLNHPGPIPDPLNPGQMIIDPYYDPDYSTTPWTLHFYPGSTTYLDTPLVPVAAFAGYPNYALDAEPADGTPVIFSAEGPVGGPILCSSSSVLVIKSVGDKVVQNPDYNPNVEGSPATITRDFGFGDIQGSVTINGTSLSIQSWTNSQIEAVSNNGVTTGTLVITRGDNGKVSDLNLTVHVGGCGSAIHVDPAPWPAHPIQDAIDAASSGDLIIVHPGTYNENVILYKDVTLQGSGAASTLINANPQPAERVTYWHDKIIDILGTDLFAANENPGIMVLGNAGFDFTQDSSAVIDGFSIMGGLSGGGIYVNSLAHYLEIRNNKVQGNQGSWGGGIVVGTPQLTDKNTHVNIHDNYVIKNGGIEGPGGIALYSGTDNYIVRNNLVMGNFSRNSGGGIGHAGLSLDGLIENNKIVSNEVFFGQLVPGGGEGGGIFIGSGTDGTAGAGSVTINANLIQGNLAGAGSGGGIRALIINGTDVGPDPAAWYSLNIFNNIIVNNVTAFAGGGIALQDAAKVNIINNTVANNSSTATAALAFPAGNLLESVPQGAGIVSFAHSATLTAASGQAFSNPILHDNIIWHNSSYYWDGTLNDSLGGILPNPAGQYQDLRVSGVAGSLNPQNCILSSTAGYPNNLAANPQFAGAYENTLLTASVLDEGGNFITTKFTPIGIRGDYHISSSSPAIDLGDGAYLNAFAELAMDYDGEERSEQVDSGADEMVAIIFSADFNAGTNAFGYQDNTFRDTTGNGFYERGDLINTGGFTGGALRVRLGGLDNNLIVGMSGGWIRSFTLAVATSINISLRYNLSQTANYENMEFSDMMLAIDSTVIGVGANDYLDRITGNGNGGGILGAGWQLFTVTVNLPAGTHTITIGGYNNQKNVSNEMTTILIDDVILSQGGSGPGPGVNTPPVINSVTATPSSILDTQISLLAVDASDTDGPSPLSYNWIVPAGAGSVSDVSVANPIYIPPAVAVNQTFTLTVEVSDGFDTVAVTVDVTVSNSDPTTIFSATFDAGTELFGYADNTFRGTAGNGYYERGDWLAGGGFSGSGLRIRLGGLDNSLVAGMSGGWSRTFTLVAPGIVDVSLRYNLAQTANYENTEFSDMMLMIDGTVIGAGANDYLARITGNGNGGPILGNVWQLFTTSVALPAGEHTITIGGYNNQKDNSNEMTTILIDDVTLTRN